MADNKNKSLADLFNQESLGPKTTSKKNKSIQKQKKEKTSSPGVPKLKKLKINLPNSPSKKEENLKKEENIVERSLAGAEKETVKNPQKTKKSKIDSQDISEKDLTNEDINRWFEESGTLPEFKEKWIRVYKAARSSKKKNYIKDKILRGKFSISETGSVEILSEMDTVNKNAKDLLKNKWEIKGWTL